MVTPGVLPDLQSGIKKCPNLFRLCGFVIRSKGVCFTLCWGIVNPRFNRSNLFFTADFKSAGTPGGGALLTPPFFSGVNRLTVNSCFLHPPPLSHTLYYINIYILIIICEWGVVCIFGLLTVNLLTPIRKTTLSSPPS